MIDPVDYGKLVEKVDRLELDMAKANAKLDAVLDKINQVRGAKWAFGVIAAVLASSITHAVHKWLP